MIFLKKRFQDEIGSIVVLSDGTCLRVVEKDTCVGCYFRRKFSDTLNEDDRLCDLELSTHLGPCSSQVRKDRKSIIFKKINKNQK